MKRTKRTTLLALSAIGALALSSCGFSDKPAEGGGGEGGEAVTLQMLVPTYSTGTKGLWEGVIKDFEAEHENITVNLEVQSWENIESVLKTKLQATRRRISTTAEHSPNSPPRNCWPRPAISPRRRPWPTSRKASPRPKSTRAPSTGCR
ncbi:hypothetical protein [Arthrobacter sp. JCM 19049]|uniref:hypothetical protein n=1 Tax=Arthrobacter sp. JCM 19049 TaxID=1460643 RepID=UPI000A5405C8|nr:hypothetical protein [Arthrobacter sp. JCM 19049]